MLLLGVRGIFTEPCVMDGWVGLPTHPWGVHRRSTQAPRGRASPKILWFGFGVDFGWFRVSGWIPWGECMGGQVFGGKCVPGFWPGKKFPPPSFPWITNVRGQVVVCDVLVPALPWGCQLTHHQGKGLRQPALHLSFFVLACALHKSTCKTFGSCNYRGFCTHSDTRLQKE